MRTSAPAAVDGLNVAFHIATRIADKAIWNGAACSWNTSALTGTGRSRRWQRALAGADLYGGTAGISLFFAELFRVSGEGRWQRLAEGAAVHALARLDQMNPADVGFFCGRTGVAYALLVLSRATRDERWRDAAAAVVAPMQHHVSTAAARTDFVGGAAGAIPALILFAQALEQPALVATASRLGDLACKLAVTECVGWSWPDKTGTNRRHLLGLAHGAAGYGLALAELYAATGEGRFRFAAEQAFAYEAQFLDGERQVWPDFRRVDLYEALVAGDMGEAVRVAHAISASRGAAEQLVPMVAWCHGAAGALLARLRARRLLRTSAFDREIDSARHAVIQSTETVDPQWSLCHGASGNLACLLADDALPAETRNGAVSFALSVAAQRLEGSAEWPCSPGVVAQNPTLMTGESGVGLFYLALHDPSTAPVLALTPGMSSSADGTGAEGYVTAREQHLDSAFRHTRALARVMLERGRDPGAQRVLGARTLPELRDGVRAWDGRAGSSYGVLVEAARFDAMREFDDRTEPLVAELIASSHGRTLRNGRLMLAAGVRCVLGGTAGHDCTESGDLTRAGAATLIWRTRDHIAARSVGGVAHAVVVCLAEPATFDELLIRIAESSGWSGSWDTLEQAVASQAEAFVGCGVIRVGP